MGDILQTLDQIRKRLNEHFQNLEPRKRDWVVLSNIVDRDGASYKGAEDRLVMFLANIQHETVVSTYNRNAPVADNKYAVVAPPLYIVLYVLFYANFSDDHYQQGVDLISRTISYFQQNPYITHESLPTLDPNIKKLTFELNNLEMTDLNYLITLAAARYLPSVYYKIRLIPFVSDAVQAEVPAVEGLENPSQPSEDRQPLVPRD